MPTSNTDAQVRQFDTLFSPLETQEQPAWLQQASPEQRRQLHQYQGLGRLARRRATQAFAQVQSLYTYNLLDLSAKDFATVTAQVFHRVQQRRSLDEVYLTYLQAMLQRRTLLDAKQDAYLATLREEYSIAHIRGHLGRQGRQLLEWIIGAYPDGSVEFPQQGPYFGPDVTVCASLRLFDDLLVPGILLLGPPVDDAPCVAYMPGHPQHPLKQYPSRTHFFSNLRGALASTAFQQYFLRFIPLRHQQRVVSSWQASDAMLDLPMDTSALDQGLRWFVQKHMIERLLDDARLLIPTTPQQADSLNTLCTPFASALEAHLLIGAGAGLCCTEEDEGQAPSQWVTPLRVIKPAPADYRRWLPDLSSYRLDAASSPTGQPDAMGLYTQGVHKAIMINQAFYRVEQAPEGHWQIRHPTDKDAYCPPLYHNGAGAWHHRHEQPQRWERLSLLRRMGPLAAGFDDARLLELGRVSGADNSSLRQMYLRDRPAPALLVHVLQRARTQDQVARSMALIAQGLAVPEIDDVPQLQAFYRAVAVYLGKEPASRRTRRSGDSTPTPGDTATPCTTGCNPPPADLYDAWSPRLNRAIALHRFELAQLDTDHAVLELQQRYPNLPLSVAQRLLDENRQRIYAPLQATPPLPLPLDVAEQARALDHDARLSNALEGFTQPASINQDTFILAVRLLEHLDHWPAGTALLLRSGARFGTPLAALGQTDVDTTSVYLDEDEGWHAISATQVLLAQDTSEFGFYRALLHALGESRSARLGFGLNEPQRLHQRLMEMALARPTRARLLLGLPVQRSWLTTTANAPTQRSPSRGEQNMFNREPLHTRLERLISHHRLPIARRYVNAYIAHLLSQNQPIGAHVTQLEQERLQLDGSLDRWVEQSADATARAERTEVAQQLVRAWECRILRRRDEVRIDSQQALPPLSVTLPAVVALRVLDTPRIDGLAAFVQRFPNLHRLELVNLPLTELPQGLENLHRLSHLNLSRTRLTPTRLAELGTLSGLQTLILNDIDVPDFSWTAQHMTRLLTRDSLRILTLQGSSARFEQGVFAALQQATHLHTLNLAQNLISLSEQDILDLGGLQRLVSLDLSANPLSRMPDVTRLQALEELDLSYLASPVDQWPTGLERLPRVHSADLRGLAIASVPEGAGLVRGLRMAYEYLPESQRQRFEDDMIATGNTLQDSDASSAGSSDSQGSTDVEPASVRHATALRDAPRLFEGMSADDQARARQLLEDNGSAVIEFFALLLRQDRLHALPPRHTAMRTRIQALIRGAFGQDLRRTLYEVALEAVSCIDRDAVVFSQLENLLHADLALASVGDAAAEGELIDMAISHWRALRLREHVSTNLPGWRRLGHQIDYSEIELHFRIALTTRLGLRDQPATQAFTGYTRWVTPAMLDEACEAVLRSQMSQLPDYLYGQAYWQRYLDFAASPQLEQVNRWRDRISEYLDAVSNEELPPPLSEDEQARLRDILHLSGRLGLHEALPDMLSLNSSEYRAAYQALMKRVEQARMELTRTILREPRPGPSSRS